MTIPFRKTAISIVAALAVMSAAFVIAASAQEPAAKRNDRPQQPATATQRREDKKPPDPTRYSYEFSQPNFIVNHILIEHDASGRGKITFERKNEQAPIVEPVELSIGALGRVLGLWTQLNFLDSTENYQSAKQFPHLGTMRIHMDDGKRNRTAEFNWSSNHLAFELITEYRRLSDQAILVFDIKLSREMQPLNAPQLMDHLELLYTRKGLSDPIQLIPLLTELRTDEHIPLIARNHADRLLKKIEK